MHLRTLTISAALGLAAAAFAQPQAAVDAPYQVRYASNLNLGDSLINIVNDGANGASHLAGTTAAIPGTICANVYAFDPQEEIVSCCSCPVTPNGLVSLSVQSDILSNTLTPVVPTSLVIKIVGTSPLIGPAGPTCAASAAQVGSLTTVPGDGEEVFLDPPGDPVPGLLAWGTTLHNGPAGRALAETAFSPATLSAGELDKLNYACGFIQGTNGQNGQGSGAGICMSCRVGGLGASSAP